MAIISGINDIKAKCLNIKFKRCRVIFRKGSILPIGLIEINLSLLLNISLVKYKDNILCYCDGVKKLQIPINNNDNDDDNNDIYTLDQELESLYEDVELEDPFSKYSPAEKEDLKEDIEFLYQKEKKDWVHRFSKNEALILALDLGYDCDEEYCIERSAMEFPGFELINETTFFYKKSCPSLLALNVEQRLTKQLNIIRDKYGTYVRIVKLDKHNHITYNDQEAIVLFNYLNKFDIISPLSIVMETNLYGQ